MSFIGWYNFLYYTVTCQWHMLFTDTIFIRLGV